MGFYGDDFTGSIDVMLQTARLGMSSRLYLSTEAFREESSLQTEIDVLGIAGIARSLTGEEMDDEVSTALTALRDSKVPFLQYKACSTADSSPTVGSIGRVIEMACQLFGDFPIPVVLAQPDFGRYTIFGNHFASEDGLVFRLDRQPTMVSHPSTPMTEADLGRHFSAQTDLPIGSIHLTEFSGDGHHRRANNASPGQIVANRIATSHNAAEVIDALTNRDLVNIGTALVQLGRTKDNAPLFAIGSGGLSLGLAAALELGKRAPNDLPLDSVRHNQTSSGRSGPVVAVSGSRSPRTAQQIEDALANGWQQVKASWSAECISRCGREVSTLLSRGISTIVTMSGPSPVDSPIVLLSDILSGILMDVLKSEIDISRLVLCGGDTSSHIMRKLGIRSLELVSNPYSNLTVCTVASGSPETLGRIFALKGGQVGPVDYFQKIQSANL